MFCLVGPEDLSCLLPCSSSRLLLRGDGGGGRAAQQYGRPANRRRFEWDPGAPPHGICSRVPLPTSASVQRGESPFIYSFIRMNRTSWIPVLQGPMRLAKLYNCTSKPICGRRLNDVVQRLDNPLHLMWLFFAFAAYRLTPTLSP